MIQVVAWRRGGTVAGEWRHVLRRGEGTAWARRGREWRAWTHGTGGGWYAALGPGQQSTGKDFKIQIQSLKP